MINKESLFVRTKFIAYLFVAIAAFEMTVAHADDEMKVPFVGCPSDGQTGPIAPPTGSTRTVHLSSKLPGAIAYYQGDGGAGVFAPAGWHCLALYGSSGEAIIVSADALPKSGVPSGSSIDAPVIEYSALSGETSGRFGVATYGHMLFPDLTKDFVKGVEDEGIESKSEIEEPKYPRDKLTFLNKTLVQFETPANAKGLGTEGYASVSHAPITGLVSLDEGDDGMGISILRISLGKKDDAWTAILLLLNTPCLTGNGCQ